MSATQCCRVCHVEKPVTEFGINRRIKSGINSVCKPCAREVAVAYRERHKKPSVQRVSKRQSIEAFKAKQREWREANKESIAKRVAAWSAANRDKCAARTARYRERNPTAVLESYLRSKELRPEWIAVRSAERRALKKRAKPSWANDFCIREAYGLAQQRTKATGIRWEVDHVVPLKSAVVCGLHVEHNLRVIPAVLNRSKGNKVTHYG